MGTLSTSLHLSEYLWTFGSWSLLIILPALILFLVAYALRHGAVATLKMASTSFTSLAMVYVAAISFSVAGPHILSPFEYARRNKMELALDLKRRAEFAQQSVSISDVMPVAFHGNSPTPFPLAGIQEYGLTNPSKKYETPSAVILIAETFTQKFSVPIGGSFAAEIPHILERYLPHLPWNHALKEFLGDRL